MRRRKLGELLGRGEILLLQDSLPNEVRQFILEVTICLREDLEGLEGHFKNLTELSWLTERVKGSSGKEELGELLTKGIELKRIQIYSDTEPIMKDLLKKRFLIYFEEKTWGPVHFEHQGEQALAIAARRTLARLKRN